ncbi:MAG: EscU/YscU/HrcU family type III secretion system export apparatus switch protein [Solirubrobacteraceae bacterium]|jgi:flagellar biosynthesis protein
MSDRGERDPNRQRRLRATALSYRRGDHAPLVLASGAGLLAERIVEKAREAGVPVREDPSLAEALAVLELGDAVPEPLFVAVAETLAWAYRLDARAGR